MPLYRVTWKSKATGFPGHGSPTPSKELAQAWAKEANQKCPEIKHWVELVEAEEAGHA